MNKIEMNKKYRNAFGPVRILCVDSKKKGMPVIGENNIGDIFQYSEYGIYINVYYDPNLNLSEIPKPVVVQLKVFPSGVLLENATVAEQIMGHLKITITGEDVKSEYTKI